MNDHHCQVCGVYADFGFRQPNGEYFFYCRAHQDQGVADPPPPRHKPDEVVPQMSFDLGSTPFGQASLEAFLRSGTYPYQTRLVAYIRCLPEGATGTGEDFSEDAKPWVGARPNPQVIGAAVNEASKKGLIEPTGRMIVPRSQASNKSKQPEWRRINVK